MKMRQVEIPLMKSDKGMISKTLISQLNNLLDGFNQIFIFFQE